MFMKKEDKNRVCPVERAGVLDTRFRRWMQSPKRILKPYIKEGMHVLDLGCGPGVYTLELARMVGEKGVVIAADLQEGMLQIVQNKIQGTTLEKIIELHQTSQHSLNLSTKTDFILAFYVMHEIPDKEILYKELHSLLKPGGKLLIIEPKGNVSKQEFETMIFQFKSLGFRSVNCSKVFFSRTVLLQKSK